MTDDTLLRKVEALLATNTRVTNGYTYTTPAPAMYPYQWLWDSCFHAIMFSHFDVARGKTELESLLAKQFENGMVPHMIYWERGDAIDIDWGMGEERSTITQPPMLAYAVWQLYEKDNDLSFLKRTYPALFHFYRYLITERDPHERRLVGLINPDESGEDNSPRFDGLLNLPPVHTEKENLDKRITLVEENRKCNFDAPFCMKNFFWVKDVPFNSIMIRNLEILAIIAGKLDKSYDAEYFNRVRDEMTASMRKFMLEDDIFWSTYGEDYKKIKVKTWAIFAPLFAKILSQDEATTLVEKYLKDPKSFWSPYPVTSVSMEEASFNPESMWRGPVWIGVNWFIHKGLLNYGFTEEAAIIRQKSIELLEKSGFREYYHPETGEGYGAKDFTWGGLAIDMHE